MYALTSSQGRQPLRHDLGGFADDVFKIVKNFDRVN